jgi:hypothetical protein
MDSKVSEEYDTSFFTVEVSNVRMHMFKLLIS